MKNFIISILILLTCFVSKCISAEDSSELWKIKVIDGKTEELAIDYNKYKVSLESYFDFLRVVCEWNVVDDVAGKVTSIDQEPYLLKNLTITKIGSWAGYIVLDVTNKSIKHKSIALMDEKGKFYILYLQFKFSTADVDDLPKIIRIQDNDLLSYKTRIPGTGSQNIQLYYTFDPVVKKPILLDLTSINIAIDKAVPKGYGIWKGGGLELEKLKYSQYVYRPSDANCCPTGGFIDLKLSIDGKVVSVIGSEYDPISKY